MIPDEKLIEHINPLELGMSHGANLRIQAFYNNVEAGIAEMWEYIDWVSMTQGEDFEPRTVAQYIEQTTISVTIPQIDTITSRRHVSVSEVVVREMLRRHHFTEKVRPTIRYRRKLFSKVYVCKITFTVEG